MQDESMQSGVGDEEQRCKILVFFLLHCFKNSHRLVSGYLVTGPLSSVYCTAAFCNAKREEPHGVVCEESAGYKM